MKLRFFITQYVDGTYEIETKHTHYAFRDDLNYDNIQAADLPELLFKITAICDKERIQAYFETN